jgi:membrane protease YdiL (CAAX protease family)
MQFAQFVLGGLWLLVAMMISERVAQVIADRLNLAVLEQLLQQALLTVFLLGGFAALNGLTERQISVSSTNALPRRSTSLQEWLRGAALGWGILLLAIAPMAITGAFHPLFWLTLRSWQLALVSLTTLALLALNLELAFRGYLFARLIAVMRPVTATILLSLAYALLSSFRPNSTSLSVAASFLMGLLFSVAYLRTHALWLGWGLHFAWDAAMALLFGLPIAGYANYSTLVTTTVSGPAWLTGAAYGPEGSIPGVVVVIVAIFILYRITRNYAWDYTHVPIVAKGYPVTIAPPAAHTAMEAEAAVKPDSLVQIAAAIPAATQTGALVSRHPTSGNQE